jgi:hypothetical protein
MNKKGAKRIQDSNKGTAYLAALEIAAHILKRLTYNSRPYYLYLKRLFYFYDLGQIIGKDRAD